MRHVIKNPQGLYYTEMRIKETREVRLKGELVGVEEIYRPAFESFKPETGSQMNTKQDCVDLMKDPVYGFPDSFAGCEVVSYSTDAKE